MPKFTVERTRYVTVVEHTYTEIETDTEEQAISLVSEMDDPDDNEWKTINTEITDYRYDVVEQDGQPVKGLCSWLHE
jgi:hypothetical protein